MLRKHFKIAVLCLCLSKAALADDTELFAASPTPPGVRPNVLIILDNSSNWNSTFGTAASNSGCADSGDHVKKFCAEVTALNNVIAGLPTDINLGLMLFSDTGANGGYLRFSLREMNAANKTAFQNMITSLIRNGTDNDATGANQPYGKGMFEAYKYFGGGTGASGSCTGSGTTAYAGANSGGSCQSDVSDYRDFAGNSLSPADASASGSSPSAKAKRRNAAMNAVFALENNALSSASDTDYSNTLTDPCQRTFIIFISNGNPSGTGGDSGAETLLGNVGGNTTPISPPNHASITDEFARFLFNSDVSTSSGQQNIVTYTVAVYDPQPSGQPSTSDQQMINLMASAAKHGGGKSYAVSKPSDLQLALDAALREIQSVNSAYAAVTLPVSVNVRGTNLNQIYLGAFRPDSTNSPRWVGNLKEYQLAYDSATNSVFLSDTSGTRHVESPTGFIVDDAESFWTSASNFWAFQPSGNPLSGSDLPDGAVVEKGGVAQRIRTIHANPDADAAQTRKIYTCTGSCTTNSQLSATPFHTSNLDPTTAAVQAAFGAVNSAYSNAATGSSGKSGEVTDIINWLRGKDNRENENQNVNASSSPIYTDVRASIHGDVIHSRPAVINYNRLGNDNDVVAFYGDNQGMFRAVKGGTNASDGYEKWGFIPQEFFGKLKRQRDNAPVNTLPPPISNTNPKDYFMDGPIGVYQKDVNNDNRFVAGDGDKVWLFIGVRRGGRFIYALDVSDPDSPAFMWKKGCFGTPVTCDLGYTELGQTWAEPKVAKITASSNPVLIFGGGYDDIVDDQDPVVNPLFNAKGRGIFVVDATNGNVLWQAGPAPAGATNNKTVSAMTYAISSDIALIDRNGDTFIDRGYVGDTGGNVWRIDIGHPDPSNWAVNKLASVGYAAGGGDTHRRKFLYPPDVVYTNDSSGAFDAVLIGSGDREHPLQGNGDIDHPVANAVVNRYYMFEDASNGSTFSGAGSGASGAILESDLDDVTSNIDGTQGLSRLGWFITLGTAEKVISSSLTLAGATFFNTHQPTSPAAGSCTSLGQARLYSVKYGNGAAVYDRNADGILNGTDRFYAGSSGALTGLAPSPVGAIIQLNGQYRQVVCNGPHCELAPGAFGARVRTFWQQLVD